MGIFWNTIAEYNAATWIYQLIILAVGVLLTLWLYMKPSSFGKVAMKVYLSLVSIWIAMVYYHIFCAEREYNNILALFWTILALIWAGDAYFGYTTFNRTRKYDLFAWVLLAMPILYPLLSIARGLSFPGITFPVMPCSVAVFMIGLLLLFSEKVSMLIVLLLFHWSMIGLSKTYFYNIPEDFLLACASIPALYIFFKEYYSASLQKDSKPRAKYINGLLILVCAVLAIMVTATMLFEF